MAFNDGDDVKEEEEEEFFFATADRDEEVVVVVIIVIIIVDEAWAIILLKGVVKCVCMLCLIVISSCERILSRFRDIFDLRF